MSSKKTRPLCEHGNKVVALNGCCSCVQEALNGLRLLRHCRVKHGMSFDDVVEVLTKSVSEPQSTDLGGDGDK
jgi:hypothetical protein